MLLKDYRNSDKLAADYTDYNCSIRTLNSLYFLNVTLILIRSYEQGVLKRHRLIVDLLSV